MRRAVARPAHHAPRTTHHAPRATHHSGVALVITLAWWRLRADIIGPLYRLGSYTATVAKGSAVALYAGATPANWAGTRKYDPSDPAWFTGETPHKGDDTAAKSADSAASAKSGDAKSGKATSDAIRRAATLAAILLPVIVGVTFMAIARRNGKAQSDNSGPTND